MTKNASEIIAFEFCKSLYNVNFLSKKNTIFSGIAASIQVFLNIEWQSARLSPHQSEKSDKNMQQSTKTFFIRTYGCPMNELDSEIMIGQLERRRLKKSKL